MIEMVVTKTTTGEQELGGATLERTLTIRSMSKEEFENFFKEKAGSLKCAEIRGLKKLSCLGCIEAAAGFVAR
jgi:hypothetical protein